MTKEDKRKVALRSAICIALLCVSTIAHAATIAVNFGDDLQAALNKAAPGDEIVLQAGATFTGNFTLPVKTFGTVITIRSSATLPDRRMTPADAPLMPIIQPPTVEPAIKCEKSNNWKFDGIVIGSNPGGIYDAMGFDGCDTITFDRLILIGGPNGQKRGIRANGTNIVLTRSHLANIWAQGQDSQAFCAWNGRGPYTLKDNYLEGAGENVMFGGAASASAADIPADILVEGNHFFKPLIWKEFSHPASVKNLFELKAAKRVTVRNNLFENNWTKSQNGYAILFTVRNDDGNCGGCTNTSGAPWTVVEDVLFEKNILRGIENGFNLIGYDSYAASGQGQRITIRHNIVEVGGTFVQAGGELGPVTISHNTVKNGWRFIYMYKGDVWPSTLTARRAGAFAVDNFTITNNLGYHTEYGVLGEGYAIGTPTLAGLTKQYTWTHNALAGVYSYPYPDVTLRPTIVQHEAQFNPDLTLIAASTYRKAASDGTDLGADLLPTPPPPPPPTLTVNANLTTNQCRLTVSAVPPDTTGGWRIQFQRNGINIGRVATATTTPVPYQRSVLVALGTYRITGLWTKTGQPSKTTEPFEVICRGELTSD